MPNRDPIARIVSYLNKFPGVGNKSARRMAFFLLRQDEAFLHAMGEAIAGLKDNLVRCGECGNVSDADPCPICSDALRDRRTICVVESIDDLASFEHAGIYNGLYHVLDGRVSPLDDQDLSEECVDFLRKHIADTCAEEVIIATNPRMEGDLTYFTLKRILAGDSPGTPKISRLAFGLPVGGSIEFADRLTLHTALEARIVSQG